MKRGSDSLVWKEFVLCHIDFEQDGVQQLTDDAKNRSFSTVDINLWLFFLSRPMNPCRCFHIFRLSHCLSIDLTHGGRGIPASCCAPSFQIKIKGNYNIISTRLSVRQTCGQRNSTHNIWSDLLLLWNRQLACTMRLADLAFPPNKGGTGHLLSVCTCLM